jgi:hypothetical protein
MKAIDYRNETWRQVLERGEGLRAAVYEALRAHGPCTTRQLAERSGIDPFSVRPRVTELVQLGFAECVGAKECLGCTRQGVAPGREGVYAAVCFDVALRAFEARVAREKSGQLALPL